jgi:hypothetical protein
VRQWPQFHVAVRAVLGRRAATVARMQRPHLYGRPLSRVTRDDLLAGVRPDWRRAIAGASAGAPPPGARTFRMATV